MTVSDQIRNCIRKKIEEGLELNVQKVMECPVCNKNKLYYRGTKSNACLYNCFVCNENGIVYVNKDGMDTLPTKEEEKEINPTLTNPDWNEDKTKEWFWYNKFGIDERKLAVQSPFYDNTTERYIFPLRKVERHESCENVPLIGRSDTQTPKWKFYNAHLMDCSYYKVKIIDESISEVFIVEDIISARKIVSKLWHSYKIPALAYALLGTNAQEDLYSDVRSLINEYAPFVWLDNDSETVKDKATKIAARCSGKVINSRRDPKYYTGADYIQILTDGRVLT